MRVLIMGHTAFKGPWLAPPFASRAHELHGSSHDPLPGGLFELADVASLLARDRPRNSLGLSEHPDLGNEEG
jgi:CDP-glucose 4,6-dehydratase